MVYTRQQLALRNGNDREEMWIAFEGIIYDVGFSRHWRNGIHYGHWAGQDLTEELKDAPHAAEVFKRCEIVGELATTE
ncbi:MAG: cytochrome b5 domain-containing protein [Bacteroidia bacterium]